jgi:hypothetical protein
LAQRDLARLRQPFALALPDLAKVSTVAPVASAAKIMISVCESI